MGSRHWSPVLGLLAILLATPAWACSCLNVNVEPDEYLRSIDLMFYGQLQSTREGRKPDCGQGCTVGTFRVESDLKGKLRETVDVMYYSEPGSSCAMGFPVDKGAVVVAHGNAQDGYWTGRCTQYPATSGQRSKEIWLLAWKNRERTKALASSDQRAPDPRVQLKLLQWLSDYHSNEEGLDAADGLLALEPQNREALLFKEKFLSALERNEESLRVTDGLLALDATDREAMQRRVLALVRLGRISEIADSWRDFSGLEAKSIDFSNKTLSHVSFRDASLTEFKFSNSNLAEANFSGSTLRDSDLSKADLSNANFSGATFNGADFKGADLRGADFDSAKGGLDLSGADISGAILTSANLTWVLLVGTKAHGAVLAGSCMDGDFSGVDLTGADLRGAQMIGKKWTGAILRNADLRGALVGAALLEADITGAFYNDLTLAPVGIDLRKRGGIKIDDAKVTEANWPPCPSP